MTQFASADFTGTDSTELSAADANWSEFRAGDDAFILSNRVYGGGPNPPCYKHGATPPSADYEVSADFYMVGTSTTYSAGVCARIVDGVLTCYWARYRYGTGWQLYRYNSGTATQLGSTFAENISAASTRKIRLKVEGSVISVYRDAETSPIISVTDGSPLSSAGYAGILTNSVSSNGPHLDNFSADTLATAATAVTLTGPTSGVSGVASTDFTVGADGTITGDVVVTPSDGGDGGTFTPTTVTINSGSPTGTFTYTPASTGTKTISVTNDGGLTNPSSISYTSTATNSAPSWSGTPSAMSAKKGQALTPQDITSLVSDADLDTLSYSITGAPTGVTINSSTGVISGTPTAAPGVYACTVEADDGIASPVSSSSFNITVTQCVLALNSAGYEFGDGNDPATMSVVASTELQIAAYPLTEWPPASAIATATATTGTNGRLADLGDDDLSFGTTYRVIARNAADGETWAWTMAAS